MMVDIMAGAKTIADVLGEEVHKVSVAVSNYFQDSNNPLFDSMPSTVPSLRSIAKFALGSAQVALLPANNAVLGGSPPSCPNAPLSCHNTTVQTNLCCFNAPGGQLLQTQFWDSNPATGPADSWTIHGLVCFLPRPFLFYNPQSHERSSMTLLLEHVVRRRSTLSPHHMYPTIKRVLIKQC